MYICNYFCRRANMLKSIGLMQIAHNVFEAGLKRFMHEPGYILE